MWGFLRLGMAVFNSGKKLNKVILVTVHWSPSLLYIYIYIYIIFLNLFARMGESTVNITTILLFCLDTNLFPFDVVAV